jgi:hypothetical protein
MAVILMFPSGARRARRGRGMTHDVFAAQEELERSHRAAQLAALLATGTTAIVMMALHLLGS